MGLLIVAEAPPAPASALIAIIAFQTGEAPLEVEVASVVAVAAEEVQQGPQPGQRAQTCRRRAGRGARP